MTQQVRAVASYTDGQGTLESVTSDATTAVPIVQTIDLTGGLSSQGGSGTFTGQLMAPVQVDGNWYYVWDRDGNNTHGAGDAISMNGLETLVFGSSAGAVLTESDRAFVVNGLSLRLPTDGNLAAQTHVNPGTLVGGVDHADGRDVYTPGQSVAGVDASGWYVAQGTPAQGTGTNMAYDDLLAIWDASNGSGSGNSAWTGSEFSSVISGAPTGWSADNQYWSATPSADGHVQIGLGTGEAYSSNDDDLRFVVFQVL